VPPSGPACGSSRRKPGVRAQVETAWGLQLLQIGRGSGLITVTTDLAFAENRLIGIADNAEFFWQLTRSLPDSRELVVFNRIERLSLWQWLAEHALAVVVSGAALLLLWLWRIGPRFGPVALDLPPARRRLLDHLRASGRFHWNNHGRDRLTEAAREACLARLSRAHPGFAALPPAERAAHLAAYAGMAENEAARLLAPGLRSAARSSSRSCGRCSRCTRAWTAARDLDLATEVHREDGTAVARRSRSFRISIEPLCSLCSLWLNCYSSREKHGTEQTRAGQIEQATKIVSAMRARSPRRSSARPKWWTR
jgi:hypothetical protein